MVLLVHEQPAHTLRVHVQPGLAQPPHVLDGLEGGVHHAHQPPGGGRVRGEEDLAADEGLHLVPEEAGEAVLLHAAHEGVAGGRGRVVVEVEDLLVLLLELVAELVEPAKKEREMGVFVSGVLPNVKGNYCI